MRDELKGILEARERLLKEQVHATSGVPFAELNELDNVGDDADESVAITMSELRVLQAGRSVAELRAVAAARRRIEDGTYGICIDCADEIEPARLAAQPTAERCLECQRKDERLYRRL